MVRGNGPAAVNETNTTQPSVNQTPKVDEEKYEGQTTTPATEGSSGGSGGGGNEEEKQQELVQGDIYFSNPTPESNSVLNESNFEVKVESIINEDHSVFLDFSGDLVLWIEFENNTDYSDSSSYKNPLSNVGSTHETTGKRGGAGKFDGINDYIRIDNNENLDFSKEITVAAWINPSNINKSMGIVSKLTDDYFKQYALRVHEGSLRFDYEEGGNNFGFSGGQIKENEWQHVAFTLDNSLNITLWVNGEPKASTTCPKETSSMNAPIIIGGWVNFYNNSYFQGEIDEVMIFKRVLKKEELKSLFDARSSPFKTEFSQLIRGESYSFQAFSKSYQGEIKKTEQRTVNISSNVPVVRITSHQDNTVITSPETELTYSLTGKTDKVDRIRIKIDETHFDDTEKNSSIIIKNLTDGYHVIKAIALDSLQQQIGDAFEITVYCDISNPPKDWYVRPPNESISYGIENGQSYENAWNGLLDVVFGQGGVEAGDNIYICGSHIYSAMTRWKITESGFSDDYPITIRMDCNEKNASYEEGVLWGYFLSEDRGVTWEGPDSNGIYTTTNLGWTRSIIQDINGKEHILLNLKKSPDLDNEQGSWYRNSTSGITYLKTMNGENPIGRIYFQPSDWLRIDTENSSYIKFYKCNIYGFEIRNNAPSIELAPDHYTFDNCDIQYGNTLITIPQGHDYWTIRNSELHNAGNAIYTITPGNMYNLLVENNYIHDIGTSNFYHQDAHGVGVQNGINFIIQNNTFENTGEAITFWSGNYVMKNNTIRRNFIKNVYDKSNTNGGGIVISGDTSPTKRTSYYIYENIILNPALNTYEDYQGGGINVNIKGDADLRIYNNIIYNEGGNHTNGRGAIRVYNNNAMEVNEVSIYNNIIYEPNYRYIYLTGGNISIDNNLYYPATPPDSRLYFGPNIEHDTNSVYSPPHFIVSDPQEKESFNLQEGSLAIDAGKFIQGYHCESPGQHPEKNCKEWYGNAPDIGAIEYVEPPATIFVDNTLTQDCQGTYSITNRDCSGAGGDAYSSLIEASNAAEPGDTVLIRGGIYNEKLSPNSGNPENPIIYKNYGNENVAISGPSLYPAIDLKYRSNVIIDGINVTSARVYVEAHGAKNTVVKNSHFSNYSQSGSFGMIRYYDGAANNYFINNHVSGDVPFTDYNDLLIIKNSTHNVIENNSFYTATHTILAVRCGSFNIIRNNYFSNDKNKIMEIYDCCEDSRDNSIPTERNIVEENIFSKTGGDGDSSPEAGIQFAGQESILRNNLFYEGLGGINFALYPGSNCNLEGNYEAYRNYKNRVYNNVFYSNHHAGILTGASTDPATLFYDNIIKNNVLINNDFRLEEGEEWKPSWWINYLNSTPVQFKPGRLDGFVFESNDILTPPGQETWAIVAGGNSPLINPPTGSQRVSWWQENYPELFTDNLEVNPLFVDETDYNFNLQSESPMIDAGAFLTKTSSAGSGTQIEVEDVLYFYDSYGIDGEKGDLIQLEGGGSARIISIDYDTNTLTLDSSLTWDAGEGVSLDYSGNAPDIGAYEYPELIVGTSIKSDSETPSLSIWSWFKGLLTGKTIKAITGNFLKL